MSTTALQARWVMPIDAPPIAGGVVTIEGERIAAVGTKPENGVTVRDLGDVILLPGLVNAHTHLEFSSLDRPLGEPGMTLPEWIKLVIASRKQPSSGDSAAVAGLRESVKAGVTTIGEISTAEGLPDYVDYLPDLIAFQEVIGFSAGRVESVFADLQQRLELQNAKYQLGISPHAPYTVHPSLLARLVQLSIERHLPIAMHLAESREELQLINENAGPFRELLEARSMWDDEVFATGRTAMDYLSLLAQSPRCLVIHGNYLSSAEIGFVASQRQRMSIVYCPRTHAYFRHAEYPLGELLSSGACVAIGTDSRASNPDLSLLDELRFVARKFESISPEQILALGTINGAQALGLEDQLGSITPGKRANLTVVRCDPNESSPATALLYGDSHPLQSWLRGRELSLTEN